MFLFRNFMHCPVIAQSLAMLLIPFILIMLLHVSIPILFLLQTLPMAEQVYNQYKLTSEQTSLQSKGILSAQIANNRLQAYQNIRESEIDVFLQNYTQYINLNYSAIQLNFAGNASLQTASSSILAKSMWFTNNVSGQNDLNSLQLQYLNKFKNIQKLIEASFVQNDSRNPPQIQMVLDNPKMYFAFPSAYDPKFQNNSYDVFDAQYLEIKNHYYQTGEEYLIFKQGTMFKLCNILLTKSRQDKGIFCFIINSINLATQLKQVTKTSIDISQINYYFMKPYNYFNETGSEVIFKFSNQNSEVNYTDNYFIEINQVIKQYFNPTYSYKLFFKQYTDSSEYIIAPVKIKDIHKDSIIAYFLIVHYFKPTNITPLSNVINTILIIFIPSLGLIILFSVLMTISMRLLLFHLQNGIYRLNWHCSYILEGDLKISIPQYDGTKDLRKIYSTYKILIEIYKISSQKFYQGSPQQVLLKYIQVLTLFKNLNYDTSSLSEIIGNCYYNARDHDNATIYYKNSIDENWKQLGQNYNLSIFDIVANYKKYCKQSLSFQNSMKLLKRKYFKLTLAILFPIVKQEDRSYIQNHFQCFRKISIGKDRLTSINLNMISAQIRYFHATMQIDNANIKLAQFEALAKRYVAHKKKKVHQEEEKYIINPYIQVQLTPQMYVDIGKLMKGVSELIVGKLSSAARLIIDSMELCSRFRPIIAGMKIQVLISIFKAYNLLTPKIVSTVYFKDHFKRDIRQVIMIFQWNRQKNSSIQKSRVWKKKSTNKAKQIFGTLEDNDRLSIIKFDYEPQTLGTLTRIRTCKRLLLHSIQQLKKIKLAKVKANIKTALKETIQRTKILKQNKYLLFFIRNDTYIYRQQIEPILQGLQKYKIIFIQFGSQLHGQISHKYFIVQADDKDTFQRVFSHKKQINFFNMVNPF